MEPTYQKLWDDTKSYLSLRYDLLRLEVLEKLSLILSLFLLISIAVILVLTACVYFSLALTYVLKDAFGSMIPGLCILGGVFLILTLLIVYFRKQWILNPLIRQLSRILFKETVSPETNEPASSDAQHPTA